MPQRSKFAGQNGPVRHLYDTADPRDVTPWNNRVNPNILCSVPGSDFNEMFMEDALILDDLGFSDRESAEILSVLWWGWGDSDG